MADKSPRLVKKSLSVSFSKNFFNDSPLASKFNKSGFHILLMSLTIISIGIITATSFSNLRVGGKRTIIDEELIGKGLIISIISIGIIYLLISSKDNETK